MVDNFDILAVVQLIQYKYNFKIHDRNFKFRSLSGMPSLISNLATANLDISPQTISNEATIVSD